jgi:hypothetical protein
MEDNVMKDLTCSESSFIEWMELREYNNGPSLYYNNNNSNNN